MLALRYLDISCNQITALPTTLRHGVDTLKIFKMTDNPIESPPTHVIFNYFLSQVGLLCGSVVVCVLCAFSVSFLTLSTYSITLYAHDCSCMYSRHVML